MSKELSKYVADYCVFDLETTGFVNPQIIEISAIKVRSGEAVSTFSTLVNPVCHIPESATRFNHITDDMVCDVPTIDMIIDDFLQFISDDILIGFNICTYDLRLMEGVVSQHRGVHFNNDYIDVLNIARNCLPNNDNHRLETLCKYFSLDITGEHRALKDCYLTMEVYERFYRDYGEEMFVWHGYAPGQSESSDPRRRYRTFVTAKYSEETKSLQELQTILKDITDDGQITFAEFEKLNTWMEGHRELEGNYPFDRVYKALRKVICGGGILTEELAELQILFTEFIDPVNNQCIQDDIATIRGKHVVVTGDFDFGSRPEVCSFVESAGGMIDANVKKATDYVVVGNKGSEAWKAGNYGGKIQKAIELKDKGYDIEIVQEDCFIEAVKRIMLEGEPECLREDDVVARDDDYDWKQPIRDMLEEMIKEMELPAGSLYLSDNYSKSGKNKGKLISHSVCIWEPDYPPMPNEKPGQNKKVVTIVLSTVKSRPDDLEMNIRGCKRLIFMSFYRRMHRLLFQRKMKRKTTKIKKKRFAL